MQFYGCNYLKKVTITSDIITIGYAAFGACTSLEELVIPFVGFDYNDTTTLTPQQKQLGYIFGTIAVTGAYQAQQRYNAAGDAVTYYIPNTLKKVVVTNDTQISYGAFMNMTSLTCVILPENRVIGNNDPEPFTTIGDYAFYGCTSLIGGHYLGMEITKNDGTLVADVEDVTITNGTIVSLKVTDGQGHILPYTIGTTGLGFTIKDNENNTIATVENVEISNGYILSATAKDVNSAKLNVNTDRVVNHVVKTTETIDKQLIIYDKVYQSDDPSTTEFDESTLIVSAKYKIRSVSTKVDDYGNQIGEPVETWDLGEDGQGYACTIVDGVIQETAKSWQEAKYYRADSIYLETAHKYMRLPSGTTTIGTYAFAGCTALTTVKYLGNHITEIPERAFSGCLELRNI